MLAHTVHTCTYLYTITYCSRGQVTVECGLAGRDHTIYGKFKEWVCTCVRMSQG